MPKTKPIRLLLSALLVALLAAPISAFAQEAPTPADVASMWGGQVVYVTGSTLGADTFTGNEPGTADDWLYLVGPDGLAHPLALTTTTSELVALPDAPNPISSAGDVATECVANGVTMGATTMGEFFIADSMLHVALGGFKYTLSLNSQPVELIEMLPAGEVASRLSDIYPVANIEHCMGMMTTPATEEPVPAPMPSEPTMPVAMCTPQMVDRTALAPHAGNVIVPEGSTFLGETFVSPERPGTVDDYVYLVDGAGVSHALSLSAPLALPQGPAVSDVYELLAMCPEGGMLDLMTEGQFFVQDNQLLVVHMGFAHPVSVMTITDEEIEAWPNGEAVSTFGAVIHAE